MEKGGNLFGAERNARLLRRIPNGLHLLDQLFRPFLFNRVGNGGTGFGCRGCQVKIQLLLRSGVPAGGMSILCRTSFR